MDNRSVLCCDCGQPYPPESFPYLCPACGGLFDFSGGLKYDPVMVNHSLPGIWPYRSTFCLPEEAELVSLGEGNTPLVRKNVRGKDVAFKCEYQNPTGSFKDRGSAIISSLLKCRNVKSVVEDSSGNAGASLAAYCARNGIGVRIYVAASAKSPKIRQICALGAELVRVQGTRSDVAEAVRMEAERGSIYASHAYLPFNLSGYATIAYEIYLQLGNRLPGTVIIPMGQGGLMIGVKRGLDALCEFLKKDLGRINESVFTYPKLIGVQAGLCAPLFEIQDVLKVNVPTTPGRNTIAEGVRVEKPIRGKEVVDELASSHGSIMAIDEEQILPGLLSLTEAGFYVEPTSALIWDALISTVDAANEPIVVILTGSGYKC